MKRNIFFVLFFLIVFFISGCESGTTTDVEKERIRIEDYVYNCSYEDYWTSDKYDFPAEEPIFKNIEMSFIDMDGLEDNKCMLSLEYKITVRPTDNPYYEIDFDTCTLTMSQLAYFKEKNADLMTMVKAADCEQNTHLFLKGESKPLDFKGQVKEILSVFVESSSGFSSSYIDYANGLLSDEEFKQAIRDEKIATSKTFKDLKDLQPEPEEQETQTKVVSAVGHYIDALSSLEEYMDTQSQEAFDSYKSAEAQAEKEMDEVGKLLE